MKAWRRGRRCLRRETTRNSFASRLLIDRKVFDPILSGLEGALQGMRLGPGLDPTADLQPLVSAKHRDSVERLVGAAADGGAQIVTGGKRPDMPGYYFEPTLIVDAGLGNAAYDREIFGPVIAAVPVDGLDGALQRADDGPYGLTASIWSNDLGAVMQAIHRLRAGTVWVNSHVPVDPNLPFGGYKQSGVGREHGRAMIDQYTELKSVCIPTPMS